jgi:hypothetical protein
MKNYVHRLLRLRSYRHTVVTNRPYKVLENSLLLAALVEKDRLPGSSAVPAYIYVLTI